MHAVRDAAPVAGGVQLTMAGRIRIGAWLPFTADERCDGRSFLWRARLGPLEVVDRFAAGSGSTRGRLLGRVTLFSADDPDTARSAAGRAALEAIWAPASLLPEHGVTWRAETDDLIIARWDVPPECPEVHMRIGRDGGLVSAWAQRWGNPDRSGFRYVPCGCEVHAEQRFGDLVVPSRITVGWQFGTPDTGRSSRPTSATYNLRPTTDRRCMEAAAAMRRNPVVRGPRAVEHSGQRTQSEGTGTMSTLIPDSSGLPADAPEPAPIDYAAAEGFGADTPPPAHATTDDESSWRSWILVGLGLVGLVALIAALIAVVALATGGIDSNASVPAPAQTEKPAATEAAAAPKLADAKGVKFEPFEQVDPTLPPVPTGPVKKFKVDVFQHVTQVSKDLAPTEVWSFAVNGKYHRGTGVSGPLVVNEGDKVEFTLVNGSSRKMSVTLPHSLDFHSAEVDPGRRYADLAPGKSMSYRFTAKHPGVYMYHCATQPVLMHTGAGMVGMMVVKPKGLAPVDKELWMTQQEYYVGQPGKAADMAKMEAKKPDVIAFNGFANQYKDSPISVKRGERVRMYVLNAGPSIWSAFHVIGTVFDTAHTDNGVAHDVQTINLAPSQGGWVEFTLDEEGTFPFVTHAFGDAVKGAIGVLKTPGAPKAGGGHDMGGSAANAEHAAGVNVSFGDMWIKSDVTAVKAGKVSFAVTNEGATMHGLAIVPAPAKVSGGMVDESTFLAKGGDLAGGASETVSADLKPGKYELLCFMAGHYAAGQKMPFEAKQ